MAQGFVEDYLLYLLARASHQVSRRFHKRVNAAGLKVPEWRVLASLMDVDGRTVGDLARITLYQQPTLTKVLDRMARQGWIERRADTQDGRRVRVHITAAGQKLTRGLVREARAHESEILQGYSARAAEDLKAALKTLIERSSD